MNSYKGLENFYNREFYRYNDKAHQIDHVLIVKNEALLLNKTLGVGVPESEIIIAALTHDIFSSLNRAMHHKLARDYVMARSNIWLTSLSHESIESIADAVYWHRASLRPKERLHGVARLVRLADRGKPILKDMVKRSYAFTTAKATENPQLEVVKHMKDKFGRNGYTSYDEDYITVYEDALKEVWIQIDDLSVSSPMIMELC